MLANLLIGLREGLEASLIVGIFAAYLIKTNRRHSLPYLWIGVASAVVVSLIVGSVLAITASELPEGVEPIVAGSVSLAAAGLVTGMLFWLAKTARSLAGHLRDEVDRAFSRGAGIGLLILAFLSVGREGVETALFMWAAASAAGQTLFPLIGAVLGIGISVALGYLIYRGMTRLNLRTFFAWSGALLVFMVAGVLSYGVGDLQVEAGLIPVGQSIAFDISSVVPEEGWVATIAQTLLGLSPVMTWLQVLVWIAYVAIVLPLFLSVTLRRLHPPQESADDITSTASLEVVRTQSEAGL